MRYRVGSYEADATALELRRAGKRVSIEPKPLRLLLDLLAHAPEVRTTAALRGALWPGEAVASGSLPRAVNALRRALGPEGRAWIQTVRGRGYRVAVPVERIEAPNGSHVDWRQLFVGRADVLSALEGRLALAEAAQGSVAILTGEPGIGKTRTAEILAERARERGAAVYWGRCTEARGGPPYMPWFEILRAQLRDEGGSDPFAGERRRVGEYLAILMPELRGRLAGIGEPPRLSPEEARMGLFDSVVDLLRHASRPRPLTLVFDDLQWADEPSLLLLAYLARRIGELRLLVVATLRSQDAGAAPELESALGELTALPHVGPALEIEGLSADEIGSIVRAALGREVDRATLSSFHARSGGNPFLVREMARELVLTGVTEAAPASVRMRVASRLLTLPDEERAVLEVAAVLGRTASLGLVSRVTGMAVPDVLDAAAGLARGGLVEEPVAGEVALRFRHDIVREAVVAELRPSARMDAHAAVAEALEAAGPAVPLAQLAHHFAEAAARLGVARALPHLRRAGDEALERLAGEEAARHYRRGLALIELEPGPWLAERCDFLLGLAMAREAIGEQAEAHRHYALAAELGRGLDAPQPFVRAVLGSTRHVPGHVPLGRHEPEAIRLLEEALDRLGDADPPLRLELLATLVPKLYWDGWAGPQRAAALGHRAVEEARANASRSLRALCLCRHHLTLWFADGLEERLSLAQEAVALVDPRHEPTLALEARFLRIVDLLEFGEIGRAYADVEHYQRLAQEIRHPHLEAQAQFWLHARAVAEGRLADAEACLQRASALVADGRAPTSRIVLTYQRLLLDWLRGDLVALDPGLDDLARATPAIPGTAALVAWLAAELGEPERAEAHLPAVAACANRLGTCFDSLVVGATGALACRALGANALAERLYDGLLPYAGRHVVGGLGIFVLGSLSRYLGILAAQLERWEDAQRHFEEARAANWRVGARLWLAETLHDHAAALLRRAAPGDLEAAQPLVEEAASLAASLGATGLARRVEPQRRQLPVTRQPHSAR